MAAGNEVAIQESAAPICDRAGRVIGAVVVFHDVTSERRLKRALSWQASHDALTGLINRREFDSRLHAALQSAATVHQPVLEAAVSLIVAETWRYPNGANMDAAITRDYHRRNGGIV